MVWAGAGFEATSVIVGDVIIVTGARGDDRIITDLEWEKRKKEEWDGPLEGTVFGVGSHVSISSP